MLGLSYGELFLIIGAAAALIGPKDLPIIARTAGKLAGRAVGYIQMARGQFEGVMQQSQARQVHKELQDTMAQLEAIRHEIRTISFLNPGPLTSRLVDNVGQSSATAVEAEPQRFAKTSAMTNPSAKDFSPPTSASYDMHTRAIGYAKLAESTTVKSAPGDNEVLKELTDESGLLVLPVSAESAGLLSNRKTTNGVQGSDIVLEAVLESEVACNAKDFFAKQSFAQPPEQVKCE